MHPGTHTCIKLWVSGRRLWVPDPHLKVHLCYKETGLGPRKKKLYGTYTIFVKKYSGVSTGSQTPMVFKKTQYSYKSFRYHTTFWAGQNQVFLLCKLHYPQVKSSYMGSSHMHWNPRCLILWYFFCSFFFYPSNAHFTRNICGKFDAEDTRPLTYNRTLVIILIRHGWNWKEIFRVSWNWTHGYCRDRNILKFKCKSVEYYLIIIYKTYIYWNHTA